MDEHVIGLDVGGTGARGLLADLNGTPLARARRDRDSGGDGTGGGGGTGGDVLVRLVEDLLAAAGVTRAEAVVLGSTGASGLGETPRATLPGLLGAAAGAGEVLFVSDALISYIGALGLAGGAVIAAGTGAVAVGSDGRGTWRKVDGWGHLLGDDGGGAWIGRAGLAAALRHHDGRPDGSPALLAALNRRFGGPAELIADVYTRADRATLLARFVPDVAAAAADGDPVAAAVLDRAGEHLAETAMAALPPGAPRVVSHAGSLIPGVARVADAFSRRLAEAGVEAAEPRGAAVDGAVLLAAAMLGGGLPPGLPESGLILGGWRERVVPGA
ncbi:BadF/BadG/BcrA/BcrD ATPase family protein [Thermopolyspora sp. NPDC052614]|uniref:BadF/BadG/BcrA/BcrD ATPase family protein n=1 Tax=Thermopolyspora sp. NPDC052614 TaxID=3155682 RepID=UPI003440FAD0